MLLRRGALALAFSVAGGVSLGAEAVRDCADCPTMVLLSGGTFVRGINSTTPQQEVAVGAFALGLNEVTVAEFALFVAATGHESSGCTVYRMMGPEPDAAASWREPGFAQSETAPVVCVSWDDATAYAAWLATVTGLPYRLPTEAEWDYAAHAGAANDVTYYFLAGLDVLGANCQDCGGVDAMGREYLLTTTSARAYPPNPFGLYDMMGNAAEWTMDCFNPTFEGAPADGKAWLAGACERRIVRGGHWYSYWPELAVFRQGIPTDLRSNSIGFRVARDVAG